MHPLRRRIELGLSTPPPADWASAFGRRAPLEVDLGCGRGTYVLARARSCPHVDLLALDSRHRWIVQIQRLAASAGLANVQAFCCDIRQDLAELLPRSSVQGFTIHHPDPWWKKRHRRRRLVRPETLELLARLLVPGGWIYLQTDVPQLAAEALEAFRSAPAFAPLDPEAFLSERLHGLLSHRGQRCQALGIPVSRLAFRLEGGSP